MQEPLTLMTKPAPRSPAFVAFSANSLDVEALDARARSAPERYALRRLDAALLGQWFEDMRKSWILGSFRS
jgi:hypothetical protein